MLTGGRRTATAAAALMDTVHGTVEVGREAEGAMQSFVIDLLFVASHVVKPNQWIEKVLWRYHDT